MKVCDDATKYLLKNTKLNISCHLAEVLQSLSSILNNK